MAVELYMVGLIVRDMEASLEFYRQLGLAVPENSDGSTHVDIKMQSGLTLFLDSNPPRWDPLYVPEETPCSDAEVPERYRSVLEFFLGTKENVDAKYEGLTALGYRGHRAPYVTSFGMYFAMIKDPDGHIILLSGEQSAVGIVGE